MIDLSPSNRLENLEVSGLAGEGPTITTRDGRPVTLFAKDADGNVIEESGNIAVEIWANGIATYENFMAGRGWLKVWYEPPPQPVDLKNAR